MMLTADCAADAPLSSTGRALAAQRPDDVLFGLGVVALGEGIAGRLGARVRHDDAEAGVRAAVARAEGSVEVTRVGDAWPPAPSLNAVRAATLVEVADRARGRKRVVYLTVAGAVERPAVRGVAPGETVAALVAAAHALVPDWVVVAGGAPGGRIVERDAPVAELGELALVLPAGHDIVRRLRTPLADWLARAASACEGCAACSDACPPSLSADLRPHLLLRGENAAASWACTGCGLCDVVCPQRLSPRLAALAIRNALSPETLRVAAGAEAERRMRAAKHAPKLPPGIDVPVPSVAQLDARLLVERLGLAEFARTPEITL
jgi:ferredoxin